MSSMDSPEKRGLGHKLISIKQDLDRCGVLFQAIKESNFDKDFKDQFWWIDDVKIVENPRLVQKFKTTKEKFRKLGRTDEQLKEVLVFSVEREKSLEEIARDGSKVVSKKRHVLGNTGRGIHLVRHYDILTRYMFHQQFPSPSYVVIFKAILGKAKPIVPRLHKDDSFVEPCVGFDCHISARRVESHMPISEALNCSYVYFYEHREESSSPVKYPRQVLPYAIIKIEAKKHLSMARSAPMLAIKTNDVKSALEVKGETRRGFRFTYHKPSKAENQKKNNHTGLKINTLKEQLLEMRTKPGASSKRVDVHLKMDHKMGQKKEKEQGENGESLSMTVQYEGEKFCLSPVVEKERGKLTSKGYAAKAIGVDKEHEIQIKVNENNSDAKSIKTSIETENTPYSKFEQNHRKLPLSLKPFIALKRLNSQEVKSKGSKKTQPSEKVKQYNSNINDSLGNAHFKDPYNFSENEISDESCKIGHKIKSNEKNGKKEFDINKDKTTQSGKIESLSDHRRNESLKRTALICESTVTQINVPKHKHYETSHTSSHHNDQENGSKAFVKPSTISRPFNIHPETTKTKCIENNTSNIAYRSSTSCETCSDSVEEIKRNNEKHKKSYTESKDNKSIGIVKNVQKKSVKRKSDTGTTPVMVKKSCTGNNINSQKITNENESLKKHYEKDYLSRDKSLSKCIEHGRISSKVSSHSFKRFETHKKFEGYSKGAYEKELKIVKDPANVCIFSKSEKENTANKNTKKSYKRTDHTRKPTTTNTKRKTISLSLPSQEKKKMAIICSGNEKEQIDYNSQKLEMNSNKFEEKSELADQNEEPVVRLSLQTNGDDNSPGNTNETDHLVHLRSESNDMAFPRSFVRESLPSEHDRDHLVLGDINASSKMEVMNTSDSRGHTASFVMESHNYACKPPCIANPVTSLPIPPPDYPPVTTFAYMPCRQLTDGPEISSPFALQEKETQVNSFPLISPPVTIKERIPRAHLDKGKDISFHLNSDKNKQNSTPYIPVLSARTDIAEQPVNLSLAREEIRDVITDRPSSNFSDKNIHENSSTSSQFGVEESQLLASTIRASSVTAEEKTIPVRNISPLKVDLSDVKKLQKLLISNFNEARKLNLVGNVPKSVFNEPKQENVIENASFENGTGNKETECDISAKERNAFPSLSNEVSQTIVPFADKHDNIRKDIHDTDSHDTLIDAQSFPITVNHVESVDVVEKTGYVYTLTSMHPPQREENDGSLVSVKHEEDQIPADQYLYQPSVQYDIQQPSLDDMQPVIVKQELVEHVKEEPEKIMSTEKEPEFSEKEMNISNDVVNSNNDEVLGTYTDSENNKTLNSGKDEDIICRVSEVKSELRSFSDYVSISSDEKENRTQEKEVPTTDLSKSYFDYFKRKDSECSAQSLEGSKREIVKSFQELTDELRRIINEVRTPIGINKDSSNLKSSECVNVCFSGENLSSVNPENNFRQRRFAEIKKSHISLDSQQKYSMKCSDKENTTSPLNNVRGMFNIRNETESLISKERSRHDSRIIVSKISDHAKMSCSRKINTSRKLKTLNQKAANLPLKTQSNSLTTVTYTESDKDTCLETNQLDCKDSSDRTGSTTPDKSAQSSQLSNHDINNDMQVKHLSSEKNSQINFVHNDTQMDSINGEQNNNLNKDNDRNDGKTKIVNTLITGGLVESRSAYNSLGDAKDHPVLENDNQIVSVHTKTQNKTESRENKRRTYDDIIPFDVIMKKRTEQYMKFKRGESINRFLTHQMLKNEFLDGHCKSESSKNLKEGDITSKDKRDKHMVVCDNRSAPNETSPSEKNIETLPTSNTDHEQKGALEKTPNSKADSRNKGSKVHSCAVASNDSSKSKGYESLSISDYDNKNRLPDTPTKINENVSLKHCPDSSNQNGTEKNTSNQKRKRSRSVSLDRSVNSDQAKKLKFDDQRKLNPETSPQNTMNASEKANMTGFFHWRRKYAPRFNCVPKKDKHQTGKDFETWKMIKERERIRSQIEIAINDYKRTFQRTGKMEDGNDKVVNYLNYLSTNLCKQGRKAGYGQCSNTPRPKRKGRCRPKKKKPKNKIITSELDGVQKNMGKNNVETLVESLLTTHSNINRDSYRQNHYGNILEKQMIEHVGQISNQIMKELHLRINSHMDGHNERKCNGNEHISKTGETYLHHSTDNIPILLTKEQKKNEERSTDEVTYKIHNYLDENKRRDTCDNNQNRKSQRDSECSKNISPYRSYESDAFMKSDKRERYCNSYNERFYNTCHRGDRLRDSDSVVNNNEWTHHDSSTFKCTAQSFYDREYDRIESVRYDEKRPHRLKSYPVERGEHWMQHCTSKRFENDRSHRNVRDNIRNDNSEKRSYDRNDESYGRCYSDYGTEDRRNIRRPHSLENTDRYSYSSRWSRRDEYSYDESGAPRGSVDADYDARSTTSEAYYTERIRENTRGSNEIYCSSSSRYIPKRNEFDGRYRSERPNRRSIRRTCYENDKKEYYEDTMGLIDTLDELSPKHRSHKRISVAKTGGSDRESKRNQFSNNENRYLPNRNDILYLPSDISSRSTRSTKSRSPFHAEDRSPEGRTSLKPDYKTLTLENSDVKMRTESPKHSLDRSLPSRSKSPINRKVNTLFNKTNKAHFLRREKSPTVHRNKSPVFAVDNASIGTKVKGTMYRPNNYIVETDDSPLAKQETNIVNANELDTEDRTKKLQSTIGRIISSMKYPYPSASS